MSDVTIKALKNGPFIIQGPVQVQDMEGKPLTPPRPTIALCRCGQSANKPFCDGTHGKCGFQG